MKKILFSAMLLAAGFLAIAATESRPARNILVQAADEVYAEIKFDTLAADLGTFPASSPEQKCSFRFTNTGGAPLVLQQVFASCGCTVPTYPKTPIKPGQSGVIEITYNGTNKFPGKFKKTVTVRSNAKTEIVRLSVSGMMTE